jgi:hypothetical protein
LRGTAFFEVVQKGLDRLRVQLVVGQPRLNDGGLLKRVDLTGVVAEKQHPHRRPVYPVVARHNLVNDVVEVFCKII